MAAIALLAPPARAAYSTSRGFEVLVHLRHPDGREETVRVASLLFVFYERIFIHHSTGIGKPAALEIQDRPHEVRSIQNEELGRVRFGKLRKLAFEYREEGGNRLLHMVTTRRSHQRKPVDWPAFFLRNSNSSQLPHFRGLVNGQMTDFPLPALQEADPAAGPVVVQIDFEFPDQKPRRKVF